MLGQRGDTIVEVVIAIAVASAALVGAYASTTKNAQSTQTSQERTQAVKIVETQIEYLRSAGTISTPGNCFAASALSGVPGTGPQGSNPCIVKSDGSMAGVLDQPAYTIQIDKAVGIYYITTSWANLGSDGINNVGMYYEPVSP